MLLRQPSKVVKGSENPETDCWVGTPTPPLTSSVSLGKASFVISFLTSKIENILISRGCYEKHMNQYMQSTYDSACKYQEALAVLLLPSGTTPGTHFPSLCMRLLYFAFAFAFAFPLLSSL